MSYVSPSLLIPGAVAPEVPHHTLDFVRKQVDKLSNENDLLKKKLLDSEMKLSLWMSAQSLIHKSNDFPDESFRVAKDFLKPDASNCSHADQIVKLSQARL